MSVEATPNAPAEPAKPTPRPPFRLAPPGQISPPMPDAEAKLRAIAEAQGVVLDGKAWERLLGAGKDLWDSDEDFERFIELLNERRKQG